MQADTDKLLAEIREKDRIRDQEKRNSALCRMAGNIAPGFFANHDRREGLSDRDLAAVADVSVKLARLIYGKVHEL